MLNERDVFKLLGSFIASEIAKQVEPLRQALGDLKNNIEQAQRRDLVLQESITRLEKALGDMPVPVDGKDGAPGKDADVEMITDDLWNRLEGGMRRMFAELPKPRDGIDGKDGEPGEPGAPGAAGKDCDMDEVEQFLEAHAAQSLELLSNRVDEKLAAIPIPKDGKDGRDGTNGADGQSVQLDDVRDWLTDLVGKTVADLPVRRDCVGGFIDRSGALHLTFSDGAIVPLGSVVGQDGKDCDMAAVAEQVSDYLAKIEKPKDGKDGRDGLGFKDMSVTFDGERSLIFRFVLEDRVEELSLSIPFMLYRGVWKEGGYERGDVVTRDGGSFVALADTLTIPGTKDCDWQLCVKRGAEGPRGKQGEPGPQGAPAEQLPNGAAQWPLTPGNK